MQTITCADCGIRFDITDAKDKALRNTGDTFYCPDGHDLTFGDSEVDKLKIELERALRSKRYWHDQHSERSRLINTLDRRVAALQGHCGRYRKIIDEMKGEQS